VPHGRSFIARFFGLAPDAGPGEFEGAPRCPVFEIGFADSPAEDQTTARQAR